MNKQVKICPLNTQPCRGRLCPIAVRLPWGSRGECYWFCGLVPEGTLLKGARAWPIEHEALQKTAADAVNIDGGEKKTPHDS